MGRYGGPCWDEAWAKRYLRAALPHLIGNAPDWAEAVRAWVVQHTPMLVLFEGDDWIAKQAAECAAKARRYPGTDRLARLLRVTESEVAAFSLRCIPAVTRPKKIREAEDRARRAQAEKDRRALDPSYIPREESKARTKPWEAEGIKRSAWYAKRRAEAVERAEIAVDDFVPDITERPSEEAVMDEFVPHINAEPSGRIRAPHLELASGTATSWQNTLRT